MILYYSKIGTRPSLWPSACLTLTRNLSIARVVVTRRFYHSKANRSTRSLSLYHSSEHGSELPNTGVQVIAQTFTSLFCSVHQCGELLWTPILKHTVIPVILWLSFVWVNFYPIDSCMHTHASETSVSPLHLVSRVAFLHAGCLENQVIICL